MWTNDSGLFLIIIAFLAILSILVYQNAETFSQLHHKTKCFSCEQSYLPKDAWMGEPTKGFDDEREAVLQTGSGWLAKTIKGV